MISYWYQATEVRRCGGRQVLEVGIGMGLTTWLLRRWGLEVATLDVDPSLEPTYVGDVRALPCADGQFDTVLAAEVLEHLPYCDFEQSLRELRRVARRNVVLTLPCPLVGFHAGLNLPLLKPLFLACGLPRCSRHRFDGQHHWELGRRGYSKRRIRRSIRAAGLTIAREYRPGLSLYSYFFVLTRQP
jgi:ubiquinone/menaquinone biosynthesis C-methylase UbiE